MKSKLIAIAMLAAALTGCGSREYLIVYEAELKGGGTLKSSTVQRLPRLTYQHLMGVMNGAYRNPAIKDGTLLILSVIPLEGD